MYSDKLSGTSTRQQRPGLAALLDYAREGDAIVVVGIDRLGRNAAEVMTTIRELGERGIVLRSLREGIDTSNATGRMVAGVLASLAELELELGRERRAAARDARRARGQSIGRPKALDDRRRLWRSGCTPVANRPAPSPPRSVSAVRPSTGFGQPADLTGSQSSASGLGLFPRCFGSHALMGGEQYPVEYRAIRRRVVVPQRADMVAFVSGSSGECPSNPCVQQRAPAGASAAGPSDGGVGSWPA